MHTLSPIEIDPKNFLFKHFALQALPSVVIKIQDILQSGEETSLKEISSLIMKDAALTTQMLKIVNSAYYSLPMEIDKVKVAVAYLGLNEIHRIILSISVMNALAGKDKEAFNEIWFHSLYTALCARELIRKYEPLLNPTEIWTSALLHDIGKLVYLKFFPEHYKMLRQYAEKNGCLFNEAEKELSLPASSYLGSLLCDRWRLPQRIKDSCSYHTLQDLKSFSETKLEDNPLKRFVLLSNLFAIITTDSLHQKKREEIIIAIKEVLSINETNFLMLLNDMSAFKDKVEALM